MKEHVRKLKKHKNVLYGVVVVLLILQIATFVSLSSQISSIDAQQNVMKEDIDKNVLKLIDEIDLAKQESQFGINELSEVTKQLSSDIVNQQNDFENQISLLKSSQADFSGVIEDVIRGVVSVGTDRSAGSGFAVADGGYIVTNFHVIQNAAFIQINTYDGRVYDANVVGGDAFADLALLKIGRNLDYLELADSDGIQIGEKVIAIGNPLGLSFTVTEGIVSAVDRTGPNGLDSYVQTDVPLNPGNSGGPLINKQGEVIGINNFKIGGTESLGFALESNEVESRINKITIEIMGIMLI
jgi:S1-C subfamily serine protease